ncbi:homoserine kinase [Marivirga tractuosa]|uniref:Homoserine kinase n=1 Tax=Marivirga tractuosa (strain ATCC 23168 / DSM 4126 / NBRC 15989 / NCIMB 1408 / VKM B-1430 / H-43) TaxID=643867 RepID=E4TSC3_MARTH|nr:homoserine kinase [Marivirga tractuosa]ADR22840.1 homoserine kinase [Marivirga tractuosa DSM 4126]BDD16488.1 homoserine kinase [Marivirga tractuosa]
MNKIKVFAPATIANVGPGYDILGLALEGVGEHLEMELLDSDEIIIHPIPDYPDLPLTPNENIAGIVAKAMLNHLGRKQGLSIKIQKAVKPGSGLGSSGCTAAATAFALNELLDTAFTPLELVEFAMLGEKATSGKAHADNVAASLMGGFCIIKSYHPLEILNIPFPKDLQIVVAHPQIEVKTADSKKILKKEMILPDVITQMGNIAALISGLTTSNFDWIRSGMNDLIAEPIRSYLIPGFRQAKSLAMENGALGCSISGSGPSIFAFCEDANQAIEIGDKWSQYYTGLEVDSVIYSSKINPKGTHKIESS